MEFKSAIFVKYLRSLYKVNLNKTNAIHKVLIEAIFNVFVQMEDDIDKMALELSISTATGEWLDLWGEYFGILRKAKESDKKYSTRMIAEVIEPKATLTALRRGATRWLNLNFDEDIPLSDIEIYEPWKDLLITSHRGTISYLGRLPDSEYWTHSVVDMAIPDSSEMSADLIHYLNTIKACGVKIVWHITMSWHVLRGYFESDSAQIWIVNYYDLWLKRSNDVYSGIRLSDRINYLDESAISSAGLLSGHLVNHFDLETHREFEPFRMTTRVVQNSPIVTLSDIAELNEVENENLTVGHVVEMELFADRQIPNLDNLGKLFEEEMKPLLDTNIKGIIEELGESTITELSNSSFEGKSIADIREMFSEDTVALEAFLSNWRTHNYFNKGINTNPLSICTGPLKILVELDT